MGDIITIKIPLIKKSIACVDCKYYGVLKETNGKRPGYCARLHSYTSEVGLTCKPKKSWKIK